MDDMGVSKLSAKVFLKVNSPFKSLGSGRFFKYSSIKSLMLINAAFINVYTNTNTVTFYYNLNVYRDSKRLL